MPFLALLFLSGCRHKNVATNAPLLQTIQSGKKPLRVGMVTGIKPEHFHISEKNR
jgi:hypothetical protein